MGWINDTKASGAAKHAREAIDKGDSVLVFKIIEANTNSRAAAPMTGVADQIQATEFQGWALADMAVAEGKALTGECVALACFFRPR